MSVATITGVFALALLQGALVALPDATAFGGLARLRSPAWVALLPAMIVLGTFAVVDLPAGASGLVMLSALGTPLLAAVSVLAVVRVPCRLPGPRTALLSAVAASMVLAVLAGGWVAQLAEAVITGLGCLCLGVGIVRLIPRRWLPAGVLAMCAVDVVLLALGPGVSAAGALTSAAASFAGPSFDHAGVGVVAVDYPDLVLAAVLGATLAADRTSQRRAAALITTLAGFYGLLLGFVNVLPATVPIAVAYFVLHYRWTPPASRVARQSLA